MPPDLRGAMRNFATGVCVATTYADRVDGRHHDAVTVNSLTSVSLDPPLVSLCLRRDSGFLRDLLETKKWAISVLDADGDGIARLFAQDRASRARAVGALAAQTGAQPGPQTGALVLDAQSCLECALWASFDLGDHVMVVGEVLAAEARRPGPALIFLHGGYHVLAGAHPDHRDHRDHRQRDRPGRDDPAEPLPPSPRVPAPVHDLPTEPEGAIT